MEPAVLGLILASGFAGLVVAGLLARLVRVWAGWALAGFLAVAVLGFILAGRASQGWDGLAYVILAMIFAAPALLGAVLGTVLGGWMRRRAGWGRGNAIKKSR